jgi:hypothetical protein
MARMRHRSCTGKLNKTLESALVLPMSPGCHSTKNQKRRRWRDSTPIWHLSRNIRSNMWTQPDTWVFRPACCKLDTQGLEAPSPKLCEQQNKMLPGRLELPTLRFNKQSHAQTS